MKIVAVTPRAVKRSGTMAQGLSHDKYSDGILMQSLNSPLGAKPGGQATHVSLKT